MASSQMLTVCVFAFFLEAPKLIVVQSELLVALGDTTVMECKTSGVPQPQVKWFKGTSFKYVHADSLCFVYTLKKLIC